MRRCRSPTAASATLWAEMETVVNAGRRKAMSRRSSKPHHGEIGTRTDALVDEGADHAVGNMIVEANGRRRTGLVGKRLEDGTRGIHGIDDAWHDELIAADQAVALHGGLIPCLTFDRGRMTLCAANERDTSVAEGHQVIDGHADTVEMVLADEIGLFA